VNEVANHTILQAKSFVTGHGFAADKSQGGLVARSIGWEAEGAFFAVCFDMVFEAERCETRVADSRRGFASCCPGQLSSKQNPGYEHTTLNACFSTF
jgi:hypothetical protein